jgi:pimeloyl-ACP methyl ester carboxylesterase
MEAMSIPRAAASAAASLAVLAAAAGLSACSAGGTSSAQPPPSPASGAASASGGGGSAAGGQAAPSGGATAGAYAAGSSAIVPSASSLNWKACGGQLAGLQCASIQVPLNYADPGGRKITIALSMVPATAPAAQQQGVMLVNPGGPGEPGRSFAASVAQGISPQLRSEYDIVGFDPRGVGGSSPSLSCDPNFFRGVRPDYVPANGAQEQVLVNRAKSYAAACEQRYGWFLPYETTTSAARDMDQIRTAFGVKQVTYYGFSYGTYLGQVFGTLYPGTVRRMVLDSTVDPTGAWYADNISQDYAFQGRLNAFFTWAAKYDDQYHLGSTEAQVQASYNRIRAKLKAKPVNGPDGPMLGADELDDTIIYTGYLNATWPSFAEALSDYLGTGSTAGLVTAYQEFGTQDENTFAVYNAVECADVNWPRSWAKWQADTETVFKTAPFQAWDNAWFNAACAFWPVKGPDKPFQVNGAKLPPILMLQGTLDPATPYAGAQNAHRLLPTARMVVVQGGGNHGQSLESPPDNCVQGYLTGYLSSGALPGKPGLVNATCAPTPDPTPLSPRERRFPSGERSSSPGAPRPPHPLARTPRGAADVKTAGRAAPWDAGTRSAPSARRGLAGRATLAICCALGSARNRRACWTTGTGRRPWRCAPSTRWLTSSSSPGSGRSGSTRGGSVPRCGASTRAAGWPQSATAVPTWSRCRHPRPRSPRSPSGRCARAGAAHPSSGRPRR